MKKLVYILIIFLGLSATTTAADQMTLTTYFPIPYGSYEELYLVPQTTKSNPCPQIGEMYVDVTTYLPYYCEDDGFGSTQWSSFGSAWKKKNQGLFGGQIWINVPTANLPNKKVGIGTNFSGASITEFALTLDTDDRILDPPDGGILMVGKSGTNTSGGDKWTTYPAFSVDLEEKGKIDAGDPGVQLGEATACFGYNNHCRGSGTPGLAFDACISAGINNSCNAGATAAFGDSNINKSHYSFVAGYDSKVGRSGPDNSGTHTMSLGGDVINEGEYSLAWGQDIKIDDPNTTDSVYPSHIFAIDLDGATSTLLDGGGVDYRHDNSMIILGGNVGVGTSNPFELLQVYKDDAPVSATMYIHSPPNASLQLVNDTMAADATTWQIRTKDGFADGNLVTGLHDSSGVCTGSNCVLSIDPEGYVGMTGVLIPSHDLQINEGLGIESPTPSILFLNQTGADQKIYVNGSRMALLFDGDSDGTFDDRFSFTANGNLGIGTVNPQAEIEVRNDGQIILESTSAHVDFQSNNGVWLLNYRQTDGKLAVFEGGANVDYLVMENNGNVGIFNTAPTSKLAVTGDVYATGVIDTTSSRELKENIKDVDTDLALATLKEMTPVKFVYKEDPLNDGRVGFIAEDVPEMIAEPDRKSINPMNVISMLTEVVQDQQKQIQKQQEMLKVLEEKINKL